MKNSVFIRFFCFWLLAAQAAIGQTLSFVTSFEQNAFLQSPADSSRTLLALLLAPDTAIDEIRFTQISNQVASFAERMARYQRRHRNDERILRMVFEQVRKQYLHTYDKNYPSFGQLFTNGNFNCVSGTALYALILQRLGYPVEIHEKAFHAYLRINLPQGPVLMDATDPYNGFVMGMAAVGKRELWYTGNELTKGKTFHRVITLRQLCGLQYYNEGVMAFNKQNYEASIGFLSKAHSLYASSDRIRKLKEAASGLQRNTTLAAAQVSEERVQQTAE